MALFILFFRFIDRNSVLEEPWELKSATFVHLPVIRDMEWYLLEMTANNLDFVDLNVIAISIRNETHER